MGALAFLFKDKLRMTRALLVVKAVEVHRERRAKPQVQPIKFPFPCSLQTQVISLGRFTSREAQYPVGYVARTCYMSPVNPAEQVWYEAKIVRPDLFTVKMASEPFLVFQGQCCNAPWEQIAAAVQRIADVKIPQPNGHALMGLSHPVIADALQRLKQLVPFASVPLPMIPGGPYSCQPFGGFQPVPLFGKHADEDGRQPAPDLHLNALMVETSAIAKPGGAVVKRKFVHEKSS
jgi:hypothetical protein